VGLLYHVIKIGVCRIYRKTMAKTAKDAFVEYYSSLLEVLPINTLVSTLYSKKLLSEDHKKKIDSLSTQREKSSYFLDNVINPGLIVGYTKLFEEMLKVMESSDDPVANHVIEQIKMFMGCSLSTDHEISYREVSSKGKYIC